MLSVHDARIRLLAALPQLAAETVPLHHAMGRILAQHLTAAFPLPAFHNSGMDGFALRAGDVCEASPESPVVLQVVGDIPAGSPAKFTVGPGQAARIMTGAALPEGADAVAPVERTDFQDRTPGSQAPAQVKILAPVDSGGFVRRQGEDVAPGAQLLGKGIRLRPQDIAMAAMTGAGGLSVYRQPRVAILSTGDELLAAGAPPMPGKIYESNGTMVAALVEEMGASPFAWNRTGQRTGGA
jgi:molybdopterin molybdotransferase